MSARPEEISNIIKEQIKNYRSRIDMKETGTFTADTATFWSQKKLWRFDRNVRMRNIAGDRFLTEQLFWDQNSRKLYSDSFIHIERSDRVIEGVGFESDENMTDYTIRHPMGIFPASDFVSRQQYRIKQALTPCLI